MTMCPVCGVRESLDHLHSALCGHEICRDCFCVKAESPADIHNAVLAAGSNRERLADLKQILKGVHCWVGWDEGYMALADYHKRMSSQMLVSIEAETSKIQAAINRHLDDLEDWRIARILELMKGFAPDAYFNRFSGAPA